MKVLMMSRNFMNLNEAKSYVVDLLKKSGCEKPRNGWESEEYTIHDGKKEVRVKWKALISEAQGTGYVKIIDNKLDFKNIYLGQTIGMGASSENLSIETNYLGKTIKTDGVSRIYPTISEYADDIQFYRNNCAIESEKDRSLKMLTRYYRAYLFSCIAMIDSFLNRYSTVERYFLSQEAKDDKRLEDILNPGRLVDRIDLWIDYFIGKENAISLKEGKEWLDFQKIRTERNKAVHAKDIFLTYSLNDMEKPLNYCKNGVGGLLVLMQKLSGHETVSYTKKVMNLPKIKLIDKQI